MRFETALKDRKVSNILISLSLIVFFAGSAPAENRLTLYRDGTLHQREIIAVNGVIDTPLEAGLIEPTLRIIPAPGVTILGVAPHATAPDITSGKEFETLAEQRRRLEDRLQALETREAIFTSAAKAQSGKAPRKSKANPDPMQAIRQGTDFAIAQLEAVYTARRKTKQEMQRVDTRLATAAKKSRSTGSFMRITVTPPRGRVTLRYATPEHGWQPQYNIYFGMDGTALLKLYARTRENVSGHRVRVSSGLLAESTTADTLLFPAGDAPLAAYRLPITEMQFTEGIFARFSAVITNTGPHYLQTGETMLFKDGAYLGKFRFEGLSSGRNRKISLGI